MERANDMAEVEQAVVELVNELRAEEEAELSEEETDGTDHPDLDEDDDNDT